MKNHEDTKGSFGYILYRGNRNDFLAER